jgi:predicted TPR repeat methyltransferase
MNRKQRRAGGKGGDIVPPAAPVDPVDLHMLGVAAFRAGDNAAAADLIHRAIAINDRLPAFHYNLAIVLKALGRLNEAAASYERAITLRPDHVNAHNNLGNVWKSLGQWDKARASFARALQYNPGNADTHYSLGILCCDLGERGQAEEHFRRCLACDPDDSRGAAILLAHLGKGAVPQRTSEAQLLSIYDVRSRFWDQEGSYFAATLVANGLRRHCGPGLDILDIGCGTGLVGVAVRDLAGRLDGVDISPAMLEKAKAKAVYDSLFEADLGSFMAQHENGYDAVLAAATLIHFGDLGPLFGAVCCCLRQTGLFVFTVFPHEASSTDYAVAASDKLAQGGCFRHSLSYVERLGAEAGFSVLELGEVIHEHDPDGKPVAGILGVLRVAP